GPARAHPRDVDLHAGARVEGTVRGLHGGYGAQTLARTDPRRGGASNKRAKRGEHAPVRFRFVVTGPDLHRRTADWPQARAAPSHLDRSLRAVHGHVPPTTHVEAPG